CRIPPGRLDLHDRGNGAAARDLQLLGRNAGGKVGVCVEQSDHMARIQLGEHLSNLPRPAAACPLANTGGSPDDGRCREWRRMSYALKRASQGVCKCITRTSPKAVRPPARRPRSSTRRAAAPPAPPRTRWRTPPGADPRAPSRTLTTTRWMAARLPCGAADV